MHARQSVATAFLILLAQFAGAVDYTNLPALQLAALSQIQLADATSCGKRLLAVGERGAIIYSDDNGQTWLQGQVPVSQLLTAIFCLPSGRAWAVGHGGVILASEDRGENWTLQFDGNDANQAWLAYARANVAELTLQVENLGSEAGDLELDLEDATYAIEDALAAVETGPADPFLDVWFRDDNYGIAVGAYGMIYRTEDGGKNWHLLADAIDNPDRYHYYSIAATSWGDLYLSGEAGLMYRSDNTGGDWQRLDTGYDGSLFGVIVAVDQSVVTFGLRGNILRSTDGGVSWQPVEMENNPGLSLYGGNRMDNDEIVLVGAGGVILRDPGRGMQFTAIRLPSRSTLSGVVQTASGGLLAVGMAGIEKAAEERR